MPSPPFVRASLLLFLWGLPLIAGAQPVDLAAGADSVLAARHEAGHFHGAAVVGQGSDVRYAAGFGAADRERGHPNTADTRFLIGSLTKQFTAALVLTLVRDGALALDAPVSTYLPDYAGPGGDRITVHQLLAHRSGLPSFADVRAASRGEPDAIGTLDFAPGTRHAYSNAGYVLLGLLAEAVTGHSYDQALRARVLGPAGVADDVGYAHSDRAIDGLASGYVPGWLWGYRRAEAVVSDGPFSAGMLYATPTALHRWTRALHTGQVLPPALVTAMTTPHADTGYGYGLLVETTTIGGRPATVYHHGGGINGFTAALRYVQVDGAEAYTIAVLDNTQSETTVQTAEALQALLAPAPGGVRSALE
jgi:CubicO group peptidase (beta-lactamase class C family)